VVTDAPVRFVRNEAMLPLPIPQTGGNLEDFKKLLNLSKSDWILLISFILFALIPTGSKPVLMITGEAGGGKSTLCRWLQDLIDPCKAPLLKGCPDARDMAVIASRRWLLTIDNLSSLSNTQSDDLCRLATGGGFVTRRLHTDDEMVCIEYKRPAVINAIDAVATRGDLIDRALMVSFNRIADHLRLDEAVLEAKFAKLRPYILGCLFDGMAAGLSQYPFTQLKRSPRMADFARFAVAAETGLGFEPGSFLKAYDQALISRPLAKVFVLRRK
jgi:energy-coupling factor transporter ATP-binding protein EcfA2